MLFTSAISASLLLASGALAQYGAPAAAAPSVAMGSSSTGAAPAGMVNVQTVHVSDQNGTLKYNPNNIVAAPGSMVQFQFNPMNHSVTQSSFAQPCVPIHNVMPNVVGVFSGFMPVAKGSKDMPVFTLAINDTKPVWIYCSQGKHCQKGMVMAINAPPDKTVEQFAALAAKAPENLAPGQVSMFSNTTMTSNSTVGSTGTSGTTMTTTASIAFSTSTSGASRTIISGAAAGFVAVFMAVVL